MSLSLFGINHRGSVLELRERFAAFGPAAARESLIVAGWREAVVVSTCNRFEVYAAGPWSAPERARRLREFAAKIAGPAPLDGGYFFDGIHAVSHLFSVASGLDSLVLGEGEILAQVKNSYESALEAQCTGKLTNVLFQRALFVGKGVRASTSIAVGQLSVASVAVELAKNIFGDLSASEVLLLGAGETAEKTARHLISAKVSKLLIANRTWENACALASKLRADPVRWDNFSSAMSRADIVISSTGSIIPVVTREIVQSALDKRDGRSLFLIDLAMPRDVAGGVDSLEGVYVYRIEDLKAIADENSSKRRAEEDAARAIIQNEADHFRRWMESLESGPEISLKHSHLRPQGRLSPARPS